MVQIAQPIPQVFPRGRWYAANLRRWGGGRPTLRNPEAPGWPRKGEQTEFEDQAIKWAIRYRDHLLGKKYRRLTGQPDADADTLKDATRKFEAHRERTVEEWTRVGDAAALNHLTTLVGEDRAVHTITPEELQAWFNARLDEGYKRSTLRQYRNNLLAFFNFVGGENPAKAVVIPKQEERDVRPWTDAELKKLRKHADRLGEDYRRFFELAVCTGGRYAELLALEPGDFNRRQHTVRFTRQLTVNRRETKGLKGDQSRTAVVLAEWWPWHPRKQGRIVPERRMMAKILDAAGMKEPGVLNHSARHTYARIMRERFHIPIAILKTYLGHAREHTTEASYGWMGSDVAIEYGQRAVYGKS